MKKIIAEKKRQRTISTGSMDGSLLTKDNKLIKDPEEIKRILEKYNNEWKANANGPDRPVTQRQTSAASSTGVTPGVIPGVTPMLQRQSSGLHKVPSNPETKNLPIPGSSPSPAENGLSSSVQNVGSNTAVNKQLEHLKSGGQGTSMGSRTSVRRQSTSSVHYIGSEGQLLTASQISLRARKQYKPLYRQDIFYTGSVTSLAEFKSTSDMSTYVR